MTRNPRPLEWLFLPAARSFQQTHWQPSVDVYQTEHGWLLKYELAGVSSDEIRVTISGNTVVVSGVRRDARLEASRQTYSMEISYNQFSRSVELPCDVSPMKVSTDYRDGMLIVYLSCEGSGA